MFHGPQLFGLLLGTCFAAGLNVYATVAMLDLLGRYGHLALPGHLSFLTHGEVIVISAILYGLEFVADKIPGFDLVWNGLHTFVRLPVAALLAYNATAHQPLEIRLLAVGLGSLVALVAHSSKLALRTTVTASPEPVSNAVLSAGEDATAIGLSWLAMHHPLVTGVVTLGLVTVLVLLLRTIVRGLRRAWRSLKGRGTPSRLTAS